jgi:hypothetical protein
VISSVVSLWYTYTVLRHAQHPEALFSFMRGTSSYFLGSALCALLPSTVNAFYLPGAAPHNYVQHDPVDVYVNALTPMLAGSDNSKLVRCFL